MMARRDLEHVLCNADDCHPHQIKHDDAQSHCDAGGDNAFLLDVVRVVFVRAVFVWAVFVFWCDRGLLRQARL